MPFPLIPFLAGAAAGATAIYLFTNKSKSAVTLAEKELPEPTDTKLGESPGSHERQRSQSRKIRTLRSLSTAASGA